MIILKNEVITILKNRIVLTRRLILLIRLNLANKLIIEIDPFIILKSAQIGC